MAKTNEVRIPVVIETTLADMKGTIDKLNKGLSQGTTKMDVGKGFGASLTKNIEKFRSEYENLSRLTQGNSVKFGDSKEAIQSGERLINLYKQIHSETGRLQQMSGLDLKKIFPDAFDSRVTELQRQMGALQSIFLQINEKELKLQIATDEVDESRKAIEALEQSYVDLAEKQAAWAKAQADSESSKKIFEQQEQDAQDAAKAFECAKLALDELRESFRQQINLNLDQVSKEIAGLESDLESLKKKKAELETSGDTKGASAIGKQISATESRLKAKKTEHKKGVDSAAAIQTATPKKLAEHAKATTSDITAQTAAVVKAQQAYKTYIDTQQAADAAASKAALARKEHTDALDREEEALKELQTAERTNTNIDKQIETTTKKMEEQKNAVTTLTTQIEGLKTKLSTKGAADLKELIPDFSEESLKTQKGVDGIIKKLQKLVDQRVTDLLAELKKIDATAEEITENVDGMKRKIGDVDDEAKDVKKTASELENLKDQVLQFFSITNSVQLFKRAVTSALNTVKELDATMTEAAVVTKFDIGDMWEQLPRYSKQAQELGVSINSMYQATTLYYQQGLKTNEAMQLGVETMKMAKIASMDSTEATKAMTAALRGFNMELNEMSATKVNDVYSQLAAVTAADTSQIATAMEKTASIAASANMEFETTAALLAQIIETTQEAPETAGTAMKTIIARFSEVKNLRDQGASKGKDSEGEDIDVNKIQTALGSVGISMEGYFAGTEGLDSILLKLAECWGDLDFETQRYIATMAAGSRQQSRFIAMMSDYKRTIELVSEANGSAGASQRQFEKTTESMESKIQRLENAWNEFLMGLANNEILKSAVDFLTMMLEGVNKLVSNLTGGNGLVKAVFSLILAVGALKGAAAGLSKIFGAVGSNFMAKLQVPGIAAQQTKQKTQQNANQDGKTYGENAARAANQAFSKGLSLKAPPSKLKGAGKKKKRKKMPSPLPKKQKGPAPNGGATDETKELNKESQELDKTLRGLDGTTKETGEGIGKLKDKNKELANSFVRSEEQIAAGQQALGQLSSGFVAAGGACMALSGLLSAMGLEEAAEAASTLGIVLVAVGGGISLISSLLPIANAGMAALGATGAASGAATAAGWTAAGAAIWSALAPLIPIILIMLAAMAAIVATILIVKAAVEAAEAATDEAQLERLNEQVERLGESANEAKSKLEEMVSAQEELNDLAGVFDNLVKGSKEWKEALIENNQKVLELLNTYPKLAQYVEKGIHGELIIAEKGFDEMIAQQQENISAAMGAQTTAVQQRDKKRLQMEVSSRLNQTMDQIREKALDAAYQEAYDKEILEKRGASSAQTAGNQARRAEAANFSNFLYDDKKFLEFAAEAAKQGMSVSGGTSWEEFAILAKQFGYTGKALEQLQQVMGTLQEDFDQLGASAQAAKIATDAKTEAMVSQVASSVSEVAESDFRDVAETMGSRGIDYDDKVAQASSQYTKALSDKGMDSQAAGEALARYSEISGLDVSEVKKQIKNGDLQKEDIAKTLAAEDVNKDIEATLQATTKIMERIAKNGDQGKVAQLKNLMTNEGLDLSMSEAASLRGKNMKEYLRSMGISQQEAVQMGYSKLDEMAKEMEENVINAKEAVDNIFSENNTYDAGEQLRLQINSLDSSLKAMGVTGGMSIEQIKKLTKGLSDIRVSGGDSAAVLQKIPGLLDNISSQNLETAINLIATADWTSEEGIESTVDALKKLGAQIDDSLVRELYSASKAMKSLNLNKLEEDLTSLQSVFKTLEEKAEQVSKVYTKEEVDALVSSGIQEDQFVRIGIDEFSFMGHTDELLEKIQKNVGLILSEMQEDISKSIEIGKAYEFFLGLTGQTPLADGTITTYDVLMERILEGPVTQQTVENIGRKNLLRLVHGLGLVDKDSPEGMFTDQELYKMIQTGYSQYYGAGGRIYQQNIATDADYAKQQKTLGIASKAGSLELLGQMYKTSKHVQDAAGERQEVVYTVSGNTDTSWLEKAGHEQIGAAMPNGATTWKVEQQTLDILQAVVSGDYSSGVLASPEMVRGLAEKLGMKGAQSSNYDSVKSFLKEYYEEMVSAEKAMDGIINANAGLSIAIEHSTQQLADAGAAMASWEMGIKNLVIAHHQAGQEIDFFNKILKDQVANFKLADENLPQYRAALYKITESARTIFGDQISVDFVKTYSELFEQWAGGGAESEKAYMEIGRLSAQSYLEGLAATKGQGEEITKTIAQLIGNVEVGATFDPTKIIQHLKDTGLTGAEVLETLNLMGYTTQAVFDDLGNVLQAGAIRNSAKGTGEEEEPPEEWENHYDKLHNTLEEINDELRERERLERQYQRLLTRNQASANKLSDLSKQKTESYEREIEKQTKVYNERFKQIQELAGASENQDLAKYVHYKKGVDGQPSIRIDWDQLETIKSQEEGDRVDKFYDKLKEWMDSMYEASSTIEEHQDAIYEEMLQGKDEYLTLEEQVKEAIITSRQKEIDQLSEVSTVIGDTNSKMLDSMQNQIDASRQARDNAKTEQEIADKQQRLAYLQQDSSGANALEILNLQKEIEQAQEDYTDTLIDQKISELQKQNDEAAAQRERQIAIMQLQLDQYSASSQVWGEVATLMGEGFDPDTGIVEGSALETLLKDSANFEGMSKIQKMDWMNQTNQQIALALKYLKDGFVGTMFSEGQEVVFVTPEGETVTGVANGDGSVQAGNMRYENVESDVYGNLSTQETTAMATENQAEADKKAAEALKNPYGKVSETSGTIGKGNNRINSGQAVFAAQDALAQEGYLGDGDVDGQFGDKTKEAVTKFQTDNNMANPDGVVGRNTKKVFAAKGYKTGGLADYTGPAWLDGTPSRPEYVLNAEQTKGFFQLIDVLSSLRTGTLKPTQNNGDNTYDIDINVDSIGSDYDVEQIANKVKDLIVNASHYRNNNAL